MKNPAPKPDSEFDAYSGNYNDVVNASIAFSGLKVDFFTRAKAERLVDLIGERFPGRRDLSILDIGCGVGNYHPYLVDRFESIHGVDVSAKSVATARESNPRVDYRAYDGHTLPFPDASFEAVYTICVMHHVPPEQWPVFAAEMKRVLKPGGMALVFEHNPLNPLTRYVVSSCEFDADAVLLRCGKTESLLRGAGLSDVNSRYILTIPASAGLFRRLDGMMERLPFGAQYFTQGVKP